MSVLFSRNGDDADFLKGAYEGQKCFLVGGGPSLNRIDLTLLQQRGIVIAAMNNIAATHVRPHLWFCCDPTAQFSEVIWKDPAILKLTKIKYLTDEKQGKGRVRRWDASRLEHVADGPLPRTCPNTFGYLHTKGWNPATFLDDPLPSWGVNSADMDPDKKGRFESVLLVALWLLYWFGFRTVYLLGVDFKMKPDAPYAFEQRYDSGRISGNNGLYAWLNRRLTEARPHFEQRGYQVLNANPASKLTAFDKISFEEAVNRAVADFPKTAYVAGHYKS